MPPEIALVESRALRASLSHRVDALDKVKALLMLPDGTFVTTKMVAAYFEVSERAINNLMVRHREELEANGFRVLRGVDISPFESFNLKPSAVSRQSIAVFERRTVLNVAMLLRDSPVARSVRSYLLDVEERVVHSAQGGSGPAADSRPHGQGMPPGRRLGPGPHWDEYEMTRRDPELEAWRRVVDGEVPVRDQPSAPVEDDGRLPAGWPESVDRRLDAMSRVSGAMSHRLDEVGHDVRRMRKDINALRSDIHRADGHR